MRHPKRRTESNRDRREKCHLPRDRTDRELPAPVEPTGRGDSHAAAQDPGHVGNGYRAQRFLVPG